jgi:hypothetical protein
MVKTPVDRPMPSASVITAAEVKPGVRRRLLAPTRRLRIRISMGDALRDEDRNCSPID